mgnify:FL=1
MQKTIILLGLAIVLVAIAYPILKWLPFGRRAGDIFFQSENGVFLFPIVTCILISIVLTVIVNWLR